MHASHQPLVDDLRRLVAVASVSGQAAALRDGAQVTAAVLRDAGCPEVELLEDPEGTGPPVVVGRAGPRHGPGVLLYAHYDVVDAGDPADWSTPPFEPQVRGGRLHGRGACDDKNAIALHAETLRRFGGAPPVPTLVVVEGQEEQLGSPALGRLLAADPARFAAEAVVVSDIANHQEGRPTMVTSLRGHLSVLVTVATQRAVAHSGMVGGGHPDAASALVRVLASLHDERGRVAVDGLLTEAVEAAWPDDAWLEAAVGPLEGTAAWDAEVPVAERLLGRPSATVLGIDLPPPAQATNVVRPAARAKVGLRLAPGQDLTAALRAVRAHLERAAPWGARVEVAELARLTGYRVDRASRPYRVMAEARQAAYGHPVQEAGTGGSIAVPALLAAAVPQAAVLLTGSADETGAAHAPDESVSLAELAREADAQVRFLAELAA